MTGERAQERKGARTAIQAPPAVGAVDGNDGRQ